MQKIVSEMAASILRVDVEVGDRVSKGDTLVVLESMKMEIPVLSEEPGTVSVIRIAAGDAVSEGDVLVETN